MELVDITYICVTLETITGGTIIRKCEENSVSFVP
jgi:hypothetical protein